MTRITLAIVALAALLAMGGLEMASQSAAPPAAMQTLATSAPTLPPQVINSGCSVSGDLVGDGNPAQVAQALCP
jgi:hypothetical protein